MKLSTRLALAMIALVLFTATAVWLLTSRDLEIAILSRTLERLQAHAKLQAVELESYVRGARADVLGFRAAVVVEGIIRARHAGGMDPIDGMAENTWRMRMTSRFLAELESKPHYLQFRIIGDLLPDLRRGDGNAIPVILYSARSANQANAVQVRAALNKSQASIDHLILALREHLADYPRLAPNKREVA
jgi:hypothetical protein